MGGIILYTLPKSSLRDKLAAMIGDFFVYDFLVKELKMWCFNQKFKSINDQRREMANAFVARHP